jgi:hypothetical protein
MVDPHVQLALPPSPAEPIGHRNFALHPATSARTRCIHRASEHTVIPTLHPATTSNAIGVGGHGGPPLRGGCGLNGLLPIDSIPINL